MAGHRDYNIGLHRRHDEDEEERIDLETVIRRGEDRDEYKWDETSQSYKKSVGRVEGPSMKKDDPHRGRQFIYRSLLS
jgi:hypothetical protein